MTNGFSPSAKRTRNNTVIPTPRPICAAHCCSLRRRKFQVLFFVVFFFFSWRRNQTDHIPNLNLIDLTATPNNYPSSISKTASSCSARGDISTTTTKIFGWYSNLVLVVPKRESKATRKIIPKSPLYMCTVHCIRIFSFFFFYTPAAKVTREPRQTNH